MNNQTEINLGFRPETYFRPERLEKHLLSKVKSAVLRKTLKNLIEKGEHDAILNGPGRNRPGLGMSNSDDSSNNQLPRLGHYHLGRWDSEPPRLRHYSQLM